MGFREIAVLLSFFICLVIVATSPFRIRFILKKAGKRLVSAKMGNALIQVLVLVFSFLILLLMKFRELGAAGDVVLCLVAILGSAIGSEELFMRNVSGLYEKGIIGNGHYLPLSEIFRVPFLTLEKEEQDRLEPTEFRVITVKKGNVTFRFLSTEECRAVLEKLEEMLAIL